MLPWMSRFPQSPDLGLKEKNISVRRDPQWSSSSTNLNLNILKTFFLNIFPTVFNTLFIVYRKYVQNKDLFYCEARDI